MGGVVVPVTEPAVVIVTELGDFLVGDEGNDALLMNSTVIGLAGMAGDDTLRGDAGRDLLFGDYFSAELFWDGTSEPIYDFSVTGNDKLFGGAGADILVSGPGDDSLFGGNGNDTYGLIGGGTDVLVEKADGGIDTVYSDSSSFTLAANFENLIFANIFTELSKPVRGIGNGLDIVIIGGMRADTLEGRAGDDTIAGSAGLDVLTGGVGRDSFAFGFAANGNGVFSTGDRADSISDFDPSKDQILLDVFSFGGFTSRPPDEGVLRARQFGLIGDVLTGSEAVLCDPLTGDLMTGDNVVFAHVAAGTVLSRLDFEWSYGNW